MKPGNFDTEITWKRLKYRKIQNRYLLPDELSGKLQSKCLEILTQKLPEKYGVENNTETL